MYRYLREEQQYRPAGTVITDRGSTGGPAEILCQDQGNVIRSDKNFVVKIDSDSYFRRMLKPTAVGTVSDVSEDERQKATCVDWKLALLLSGVREIRGIKRCSCTESSCGHGH